jgi:hypothetical protein
MADKLTPKQFLLVRIDALYQLGCHLGMYGKLANNPYEKGEKPYEWEVIFECVSMLYVENQSPITFTCISMMLDYLFPRWKEFVSPEIFGKTLKRESMEVSRWRRNVLNRDGNACVECGVNENLQVHHICQWSEYPALRVDVDNGQTLCGGCHYKKHPKMGSGLFRIAS